MKGSTQERYFLPAPNGFRHLHKKILGADMKGSTQKRCLLPAPNVTRHLHKRLFEQT